MEGLPLSRVEAPLQPPMLVLVVLGILDKNPYFGGGTGMAATDWDMLLEAERVIQSHFPEAILVGGTAAALHAEHRVSLDADSGLVDLRRHFPEVLSKIENLAGWKTRRVPPPVLILGNFHGVDVGIRQLVRSAPLETTTIEGIVIPTMAEMLRIKGWLVVTRNAVRDYLDVCALADRLGQDVEAALQSMDTLYPQPDEADATSQQLAKMLAEPRPFDFRPEEDSLTVCRKLRAPRTDWEFVTGSCRQLSARRLRSIVE